MLRFHRSAGFGLSAALKHCSSHFIVGMKTGLGYLLTKMSISMTSAKIKKAGWTVKAI